MLQQSNANSKIVSQIFQILILHTSRMLSKEVQKAERTMPPSFVQIRQPDTCRDSSADRKTCRAIEFAALGLQAAKLFRVYLGLGLFSQSTFCLHLSPSLSTGIYLCVCVCVCVRQCLSQCAVLGTYGAGQFPLSLSPALVALFFSA